jgi:antitoxin CptB
MSDARQLDRLRWRCRRGMLELDLLLERFVDRELARLGADEQRALERLLDLPDDELLDYCYRRARPADPALAALVDRIAG